MGSKVKKHGGLYQVLEPDFDDLINQELSVTEFLQCHEFIGGRSLGEYSDAVRFVWDFDCPMFTMSVLMNEEKKKRDAYMKMEREKELEKRQMTRDDERTVNIKLIDYMRTPGPVRNAGEFRYVFEINNVSLTVLHQISATRGLFEFALNPQFMMTGILKAYMPEAVAKVGKEGIWTTAMMMLASVLRDLQEAGVSSQDCLGLMPSGILLKVIVRVDLIAVVDLMRIVGEQEFSKLSHIMGNLINEVHPWAIDWAQAQMMPRPQAEYRRR